MNPDLDAVSSGWIALFTELEAAGVPSLAHLSELATDDICFRDPFNDVRGRESLRRLLAHTRRQVTGIRFEVQDKAWSGRTLYLRWVMSGRIKWLGNLHVSGMSEVRFADDGRVSAHLDYWDAAEQFYGRMPVIGALLRLLGSAARVS